MRQLAAALEISAESFAEVWNELAARRREDRGIAGINAPTGNKCAQIRARTARAAAERIYLMDGGNTQQFSPTYEYEAPPDPRVEDQNEKLWNT